jgi:hypothetical protein
MCIDELCEIDRLKKLGEVGIVEKRKMIAPDEQLSI